MEDHGQCVINKCLFKAERHHIKTRGSGGSDEEWNILHICRFHHTEIHKIGAYRFSNKYPEIKQILSEKGWEFKNEFGVVRLRERDE